MTVSIGVGIFQFAQHRNDDGFYGAIDVALYAAKQRGRNRVVSATMLDTVPFDVAGGRKKQSTAQLSVQENPGPCLS